MADSFESYPVSLVHRLIEPGPTVLITTAGQERPTIMTNGFNMPVRHDGTLAVVVGPWDATYAALHRRRECVIAVPGVDLIETTVDIGNCSSANTDKWKRFGLTPLPASGDRIDWPVMDVQELQEELGRGNPYGALVVLADFTSTATAQLAIPNGGGGGRFR